MLNAQVIANANATLKHPSLAGRRLLLVQPYGPDGKSPDGEPLLAVDTHGASTGDEVSITSDGKTVREMLNSDTTPVRWTVLGIRDA